MTSVTSLAYWKQLGASLLQTLIAYPKEAIISMSMATSFSIAVEAEGEVERMAIRTGMGLILALTASIASTILRKQNSINILLDWLLTASSAALGVFYAQGLNLEIENGKVEYTYILIALHLCIACAWLPLRSADRFWNAVSALFYRFLYAMLFTTILFTGLTLAISAIRVLFGWLTFNEFELYIVSVAYCVFMTMFFLNGMPSVQSTEQPPIVPKLTISFVKYVLVPLIGVFTVILYAYSIKLITTSMSEEMAGYVLWLTGVSLFTCLLAWPQRTEITPIWRFLYVWLYPLLLPLLGFAAWSLTVRYSTQGIDHLGFTMGIIECIAIVSIVVSIILRSRDPRIPAITGLTILAITSVGPIGVNTVVSNSQRSHATVKSSGKKSTVFTGLAKPLQRQARIVTYENGERWVTTFHCSADTISSSEARVAYEGKGALVVIRRNHNDTLRFDLATLLSKLNPADSIYPPQTITNEKGRRATLLISSMATFENASDSLKPAVRELSWIEGAVYCEPK